MARGDWNYGGNTKFTGRDAYVGFRWRYDNTLEEAQATNKDLIRVEPYSYKTSSITTYDEQWENVYLVCKYGGTYTSIWFERRIHFNKGSTGSNNKYYFSPTRTYNWTGGTSHDGSTIQIAVPYPPEIVSGTKRATNNLTLFDDTGNCGYVFELEHNDDGTPKSSVEILISNTSNPANNSKGIGTSSYPCKPKLTITLDTILRGTRIWKKTDRYPSVDNGWERVGIIGVKDHAATEQHYVYKKTDRYPSIDNGWERVYG